MAITIEGKDRMPSGAKIEFVEGEGFVVVGCRKSPRSCEQRKPIRKTDIVYCDDITVHVDTRTWSVRCGSNR